MAQCHRPPGITPAHPRLPITDHPYTYIIPFITRRPASAICKNTYDSLLNPGAAYSTTDTLANLLLPALLRLRKK